MIYDQYFLDEKRSIACHNWPLLQFCQVYEESIRLKRKASPFLPPLCLTSKKLRTELLPCLLEVAHFEFDDCVALGRILAAPQLPCLRFAVRKATMKNINGQRERLILAFNNSTHREDTRELAREHNKCYSAILPFAPRLRELNITLYAPLLCTSWNAYISQSVQAIPIDDYLDDLQIDTILGLDELQRLNIMGISGGCNKSKHITRNDSTIFDDESSNLAAILHFCRQIKHGFAVRGRNVVVKACLRYNVNECMEETFE